MVTVKLVTNISDIVYYRNTVCRTKIHVYMVTVVQKGIFISVLRMSHSPNIYQAESIYSIIQYYADMVQFQWDMMG